MRLRTKILGAPPPKKSIQNTYQAFLVSKKSELGRIKNIGKIQEEFRKLQETDNLEKYERMVQDADNKFNEELFHYNNKIQGKSQQKYSHPKQIPEKPKRPQAAFYNYFDENKKLYHDQMEKEVLSYKEMIKIASQNFSSLSLKQRNPFDEKYQKEMNKYKIELKKWNDKYGDVETDNNHHKLQNRQGRTKSVAEQKRNSKTVSKSLTKQRKDSQSNKGKDISKKGRRASTTILIQNTSDQVLHSSGSKQRSPSQKSKKRMVSESQERKNSKSSANRRDSLARSSRKSEITLNVPSSSKRSKKSDIVQSNSKSKSPNPKGAKKSKNDNNIDRNIKANKRQQ